MHVANVLARTAVIVVGVLILVGELPLFATDSPLNETFGIIVVLFGLYRLVQYLSNRRQNVDE